MDESALSEEETQRREWQRQQREKALELRADGQEYVNLTKKKRKPLEARKLEKRLMKRKQESAASRRAVQKEVKKQKRMAPDIVIVPIFWKGEAKQMATVLSACTDAQAALKDFPQRIELDAGHKYTPGQKFAHWEHKGVKLRVEIGPREAERGCCTVARTFTPGFPAHRTQRVKIQTEALTNALAAAGALEAAADDDDADADGPRSDTADAAEATVKVPARATGTNTGGVGGDDLEDDFAVANGNGDENSDSDEEELASQKKKKKKKNDGASMSSGSGASSTGGAKTVKGKSSRVVSF